MYRNIEAERARNGLSHGQLAKELGVTQKTLRGWINGSASFPVEKLVSMADLFHCTTDYLLGRETA